MIYIGSIVVTLSGRTGWVVLVVGQSALVTVDGSWPIPMRLQDLAPIQHGWPN